jgi:hypothetical protein
MGNQTDTEDIESFWEGLRPQRDPSTFTNVPVVDGVALDGPVALLNQPEGDWYLTRHEVDYGENSAIEVSEANVTFTIIGPVTESRILTDPPYSSRLSGEDRANISLLREIVSTTGRLRQLLNTAGIPYNFTRLIDVIDEKAEELNIAPENPSISYFREMTALLSYPEDPNVRR